MRRQTWLWVGATICLVLGLLAGWVTVYAYFVEHNLHNPANAWWNVKFAQFLQRWCGGFSAWFLLCGAFLLVGALSPKQTRLAGRVFLAFGLVIAFGTATFVIPDALLKYFHFTRHGEPISILSYLFMGGGLILLSWVCAVFFLLVGVGLLYAARLKDRRHRSEVQGPPSPEPVSAGPAPAAVRERSERRAWLVFFGVASCLAISLPVLRRMALRRQVEARRMAQDRVSRDWPAERLVTLARQHILQRDSKHFGHPLTSAVRVKQPQVSADRTKVLWEGCTGGWLNLSVNFWAGSPIGVSHGEPCERMDDTKLVDFARRHALDAAAKPYERLTPAELHSTPKVVQNYGLKTVVWEGCIGRRTELHVNVSDYTGVLEAPLRRGSPCLTGEDKQRLAARARAYAKGDPAVQQLAGSASWEESSIDPTMTFGEDGLVSVRVDGKYPKTCGEGQWIVDVEMVMNVDGELLRLQPERVEHLCTSWHGPWE